MEISKDEAIKLAKRDYYKKWRSQNKDKVKAAKERYWEKKALEIINTTKK